MEECASYLKPTSAFKSHEKEGKEILNKVRQEHVRAAGRPSFGFPRQVDHYDTVYVLSPNEHQKEELRTSGLKFGRESPKDIFSVTKDPSAEDLSTPRRGSRSPSMVGSLPLTSESAQKSCDSGSFQATRPTTAPAVNATRATMIRKELFREPNSFSSISSPKESGSTTAAAAAAGVGVKKTEESPPSSILPTVKQEKQSTKLNPTADSVGTERLPRPSTAPSPVKQKSGDVSLPKVVAPASSSANTSTKPAESLATPGSSAAVPSSTSAAASSAKHEDRPQGEPRPSAALNERPSAQPSATRETMDDEANQKNWADKVESGSDVETANETTQRDGQVLDEPTTGHGVEADADLETGCQPVDLHGAEEKVEDIRGEIAEISEIIAALNRDLVANVTNAAMASFHIARAPPPDETSASSPKINTSPSTAAVHEAEASVIQWDPREFMQRIENCVKDTVACAVDDALLAVLALKQRNREVAAQAASESKKRLRAEKANRPQPQAPTEDRSQTTAAVTEAVAGDPAPVVVVEENPKQSSEPSENSEQLQERSIEIASEAKEPSVVKDVPVAAVSTADAPEVVTVVASDSREPDVAPVGTVFDSFLSRYLHPPTEAAAVAGLVEASTTSDGSPQRQKTKKSKAKAKAKEKKSAKKPAAVAPHQPPQDVFSDDSSDDDRGSGHEEDYDGDGDVTHGDGRHERVTGQRRKKAPHICACDVCAMLKREKHVLKNMYMTWREVRRMHRATRRGAPVPSLPADDASDAIPLPPDQLLGLCLSEMVKFSAESHRLLQSCQRSFVGPKTSEQHAPFQCDKVSKEAPATADG